MAECYAPGMLDSFDVKLRREAKYVRDLKLGGRKAKGALMPVPAARARKTRRAWRAAGTARRSARIFVPRDLRRQRSGQRPDCGLVHVGLQRACVGRGCVPAMRDWTSTLIVAAM